MMELFKNIEIKNKARVSFPEKRTYLDIITTTKPLDKEKGKNGELIALMEQQKDKRKYNVLTVVLDSKANEKMTFDIIQYEIFKAWEKGLFESIGENRHIFYTFFKSPEELKASNI